MSAVMVQAARHARKASVDGKVFEIVITEIGIIVRAHGPARRVGSVSASAEITWPEFEHHPALLFKAVAAVERKLEAAQRQAS